MEFEIHGDTTEALEDHVRQRFTAALNQHDKHVTQVVVRLTDINGPKGGVDKVCKVHVRLDGRDDLRIEEVNEDMYASISLAADRVKQAAGRQLDRKYDHHKRSNKT